MKTTINQQVCNIGNNLVFLSQENIGLNNENNEYEVVGHNRIFAMRKGSMKWWYVYEFDTQNGAKIINSKTFVSPRFTADDNKYKQKAFDYLTALMYEFFSKNS